MVWSWFNSVLDPGATISIANLIAADTITGAWWLDRDWIIVDDSIKHSREHNQHSQAPEEQFTLRD
jgi:hypothetical protein